MVHELAGMLERQEYDRCVDVARLLLSVGGHTADELAQINLVLCRSYLALSDQQRALETGRAAVEAAEGAALPYLLTAALSEYGVALAGSRQFAGALECFERYWAAEGPFGVRWADPFYGS